MIQLIDHFVDLVCEFSSGGDYKDLGMSLELPYPLLTSQFLQQRENESKSFSRTSLILANKVFSVDNRHKAISLDLKQLGDPLFF
jgi:hypothetical protein